jgi:hypothetical protein
VLADLLVLLPVAQLVLLAAVEGNLRGQGEQACMISRQVFENVAHVTAVGT